MEEDVGDLDVELGRGVAHRVHRAHPQVPNEKEMQAIQPPLLLPHCVEVTDPLGRMLTPPIAAIEDRHARPAGRLRGSAFLKVADCDHVAVELEHVHGVLDRLLIEVARSGHLRVGEAQDVAA